MNYQYPKLTHFTQRLLYLSLSAMAVVAVMQQLLFPIKPALPRVSDALPSSLSNLDLHLVPQALKSNSLSFERQYIAGKSKRYLISGGKDLILTPLSSWMHIAIDPLDISGGLAPEQQLTKAKILTIIPKQLQIAIGKLNESTAYQGCLMPDGQVAMDSQNLAAPKPSFKQRTLNTLWPSSLYSFSCVLITTNQVSLLDGSNASRAFLRDLSRSIDWPR
jgi:hypothetical protein